MIHGRSGRRSTPADERCYLDTEIWRRRIELQAELFLHRCQAVGERREQKIFAFIVGLGLGVWAVDDAVQAQLFAEAFAKTFRDGLFPNIEALNFSWFPSETNTKYGREEEGLLNFPLAADGGAFVTDRQESKARVLFNQRSPFDKL